MKEAIWEKGFKANRDLGEKNMLGQARALGLNMKRFEADMRGPCVKRVEEEHQSLRQLDVSGTPTFFVNGRYVGGSQPFQNFKALIDEELAKASEIIRTQGVQPREYYDTQIVAKGRKGPRVIYAPWPASTWRTTTKSETIRAWAASSSCRPPTSTSLECSCIRHQLPRRA